jgi:hypothetical protein
VETARTQALIGFAGTNSKTLKNLSANIGNHFASIVISSMDGKPLPETSRMLLTAGSRVSNTGLKWNDAHTRVAEQGHSPSLIEPVSGSILLRNLQGASAVSTQALDGSGRPMGSTAARKTPGGWEIPLGDFVTPWYLISVQR